MARGPPLRYVVADGGLVSYGLMPSTRSGARPGTSIATQGRKTSGLLVQAPTKYELAINLETAKALWLIVPPTVLARADPQSVEEERLVAAIQKPGFRVVDRA